MAETSMPVAQAIAIGLLAVMAACFFCALLGAAVLVIQNLPKQKVQPKWQPAAHQLVLPEAQRRMRSKISKP